MLNKDQRMFLLSFLRNPRNVGSVMPGSKALGKAMARQVDTRREGYIVELGGGTGSITRELIRSGVPAEKLIILERDAKLAAHLKHQFPQSVVIHGDAIDLRGLLKARGIENVHTIVSCLPLLSIPAAPRQAILTEAFAALPEDGNFVQYTYSFKSPIPSKQMDSLGIEGKPVKRVWRNFPPARVWTFDPPHRAA